MSRKQWRLSDFDKYLKPLHLAGKQQVLTITHIGVEPIKTRRREFTIAGDAPEESEDDLLLVLHFREYPKPLRVNNLNRAKLREWVGDDPAVLVGCRVTLRPITLKQFGGQEAIDIVSVERPRPAAPQPALPVTEPVDNVGVTNPEVGLVPNGQDFGKVVHDLGIDAKTAQAVRVAYTTAGQTDWQGAINELKAKR